MLTPPAQPLTVHKCSYPVIHVILTRAHEGDCATDGGAGGRPPPPIRHHSSAWRSLGWVSASPLSQHPGRWYLNLYVSEMITPMPTHPPDLWTPPSSSLRHLGAAPPPKAGPWGCPPLQQPAESSFPMRYRNQTPGGTPSDPPGLAGPLSSSTGR